MGRHIVFMLTLFHISNEVENIFCLTVITIPEICKSIKGIKELVESLVCHSLASFTFYGDTLDCAVMAVPCIGSGRW